VRAGVGRASVACGLASRRGTVGLIVSILALAVAGVPLVTQHDSRRPHQTCAALIESMLLVERAYVAGVITDAGRAHALGVLRQQERRCSWD
jgi:hypothetical protein